MCSTRIQTHICIYLQHTTICIQMLEVLKNLRPLMGVNSYLLFGGRATSVLICTVCVCVSLQALLTALIEAPRSRLMNVQSD